MLYSRMTRPITIPLKQRTGDGRCVSFAVAMMTGSTPEEFEAFVSTMPVWGRPHPPYEDIHVYAYLLSRGILCGLGFTDEKPKDGVFKIRYDVMDHPAYVVVSGPSGITHAIYWDGTGIYDPDPNTRNGLSPNDYKILLWVPIYSVK